MRKKRQGHRPARDQCRLGLAKALTQAVWSSNRQELGVSNLLDQHRKDTAGFEAHEIRGEQEHSLLQISDMSVKVNWDVMVSGMLLCRATPALVCHLGTIRYLPETSKCVSMTICSPFVGSGGECAFQRASSLPCTLGARPGRVNYTGAWSRRVEVNSRDLCVVIEA